MIEVVDLRKVFRDKQEGDVRAVDGVSFQSQTGEVFGLLGPNGAGKTTTLRILSTALKPSSGTILVDGIDVAERPGEVRRRIGFLSGSTALYPRLTPREIVTYFARLYGLDDETIEERTEELFTRLGMLDFADRKTDTLSTGQKQKASIARTVIHDPPIVVFDEPTSGLDVMTSREIIKLVRQCREEGKCVVFSTHHMGEAERLCDRIAVIHRGRIFADGTPAELMAGTNSDDLESAFLRLIGEAA